MKTIKLVDVLPPTVTPRAARRRLRQLRLAGDKRLPKVVGNGWEFPATAAKTVRKLVMPAND